MFEAAKSLSVHCGDEQVTSCLSQTPRTRKHTDCSGDSSGVL